MDLVILFGVLFGFLIIGAPLGVCLGLGTQAV